MTASRAWEEANNAYLAAALHWLRLRLRPLAAAGGAAQAELERAPEDDALSAAWQEMQDTAGIDPPPALPVLARLLGLTAFEEQVLLLCCAVELDPGTASRCALAQDDSRLDHPTLALALRLFADPAWDVVSPWRPLRYWRLIEVATSPNRPLTMSPLRADERIVNYVKGINELDERLEPLLTAVPPRGPAAVPPSQSELAGQVLDRWAAVAVNDTSPVIQLIGACTGAKRTVAAAVAERLSRRLYTVPSTAFGIWAGDGDTLARLWHRESILGPVALLVEDVDGADAGSDLGAAARRFLSRTDGLLMLSARQPWALPARPFLVANVPPPTRAERVGAWRRVLPANTANAVIDRLAGQFEIDAADIRTAARAALGACKDGGDLMSRLWPECLAATRPAMEALAQRLEPVATWDDLVLPPAEAELLHRIAAQVRHRDAVYDAWGFGARGGRGLGITALFAGPSGTGKTTAAEVLAAELGLDLYCIDLSLVVSKYIGETEKNLRQLFDAADASGAVLFFDEADALFGKRSEVRDSHDRYANIEVSYLLQRMEAYRGLAVLATNRQSALDPAFLRRLRFVVTFPAPDRQYRRAIWQRAFPVATPTGQLDFDILAGLPATGGVIRNIAVNAAFAAAEDGGVVTMSLVLDAARTEFRKLGQPLPRTLQPARNQQGGLVIVRLRIDRLVLHDLALPGAERARLVAALSDGLPVLLASDDGWQPRTEPRASATAAVSPGEPDGQRWGGALARAIAATLRTAPR